ncbi:MAG: 1-acyl-sn-glycerol-3-phosphate acyltransferase [Clostridiales bacterium]|nr:1-acyl-sn-glycerol-3-phosphate acyltransferase [Clostridiales bacterium]
MKAFDYSRIKKYKFAVLMKPFFKTVFLGSYRVQVIGRENIPKEGGFIVASNHISGIDAVFIYVLLRTPIHYMGKQELFELPVLGTMYQHLNGFPVTRGTGDKKAIKYAIDVVKQGGVLGIFPEGTRSKDFTPQPAKAGVALIARQAKAGVLPVSIYSEGRAKPFSKVTVRFGEIIPYENFTFGSGIKSNELKDALDLVMNKVKALWALKHSK